MTVGQRIGATHDPSNEVELVQRRAEVKFLAAGSDGYRSHGGPGRRGKRQAEAERAPAASPASWRENGNRVMGCSFRIAGPAGEAGRALDTRFYLKMLRLDECHERLDTEPRPAATVV